MPIPDADSAFVPPEKLSDYLLDLSHPIGGAKARWFISVGYQSENPVRLETDLLEMVHSSSDFEKEETRFGVKYVVRGQLQTPNGGVASVVTVWITEIAESKPRLVTAYPGEH